MARHPLHTSRFYSGYDAGPRRFDPHHCHWAAVVGDRIRRIRTARGWRLVDLAQAVVKSDGRPLYSFQHLSRLERGWATAPLYVYLAIAAAFDIDPGRLLGPDSALLDASEAEVTLLRALREMQVEPHEALAAMLQARSTAMRSSSPSMRVESPPPS